jgi:hypothetical protein
VLWKKFCKSLSWSSYDSLKKKKEFAVNLIKANLLKQQGIAVRILEIWKFLIDTIVNSFRSVARLYKNFYWLILIRLSMLLFNSRNVYQTTRWQSTLWRKALTEEVTFAQVVKTFIVFHENGIFVTLLTTVRNWIYPQADEVTQNHNAVFNRNLILISTPTAPNFFKFPQNIFWKFQNFCINWYKSIEVSEEFALSTIAVSVA